MPTVPNCAPAIRALFKSFTSVHEDPFQDSHAAVSELAVPPAHTNAVAVPLPPDPSLLAVFKSLTSVQEVPSHDSVFPIFAVVYPPAPIAAV